MRDFLLFAFRNIKHRKVRSWLTILGIVIGIASVVAMITLSDGLQNAVEDQFNKIGADRIFVVPGKANIMASAAPGSKGLTTKDVDVIKNMREVSKVNSYLAKIDVIKYRNDAQVAKYLYGVDTSIVQEFWKDYGFDLEKGEFFKKGSRKVAMLGYKAANELFDKDVKINDVIELNSTKFRVVGIFKQIGSEQEDYAISVPLDDIRDIYNEPDDVSFIELKINKGVDMGFIAEKIKRKLKQKRDDDNFQVFTPDQIMRQFNSILGIIRIALGGIAAISLLVGSLGIMNIMYANVLERTREIGIMKSVGATYYQILYVFLLESSIMGLIGGILGIAFGFAISFVVEKIAVQQGFSLLKIALDLGLIVKMVIFSVFIGLISGYLPSRRAAKLNPVIALKG